MSSRRLIAVSVASLVLLASACRRPSEPPARSSSAATPTTTAAHASSAPPAVAGALACASCHPDETARWSRSAHRLAARRVDAPPPPAARFTADARIAESGRGVASFAVPDAQRGRAMVAADASGNEAPRTAELVIGGRRREEFLTTVASGLQVLPLAWSSTREEWIDPVAEELGQATTRDSPWWWTLPSRSWERQCSRCHPVGPGAPSDESALAPPPAARLEPGIECEHCHGAAAAHVAAMKSGGASTQSRDVGFTAHPACASCHAVGTHAPRTEHAPLTVAASWLDDLLPATLWTPNGKDAAFWLDGRPMVPHGYEVQALAQSACARRGGATCVTCHDPHGGATDRTSLRDADPDASCRGCHAAVAGDAAAHAHHRAPSASVPLAADEPRGPRKDRLPGCVDCHAPALLPFSPVDRVRDHAIGTPSPENAADFGIPDACSTCHAGAMTPQQLARQLDAWYPKLGNRPLSHRRRQWARAFASIVKPPESTESVNAAVAALAGVLQDPDADAWTKASAANALGTIGPRAHDVVGALVAAMDAGANAPTPESSAGGGTSPSSTAGPPGASATDPVLARAVALALGRVGGDAAVLRRIANSTDDWRVRVEAVTGLALLDDPSGIEGLSAMRADTTLPQAARAAAASELGLAFITRRALRRAEVALDEATRLAPENVAAWLNLGVARAGLGDLAGARAAWTRVLELSPAHALARANLDALKTRESGR